MHCTSNAGIGTGKCMEFQNQKRFSSFSRRASAKNAWYGYISSQPSHPGGVSIEYGLGNDPTGVDVANECPSSPRLRRDSEGENNSPSGRCPASAREGGGAGELLENRHAGGGDREIAHLPRSEERR